MRGPSTEHCLLLGLLGCFLRPSHQGRPHTWLWAPLPGARSLHWHADAPQGRLAVQVASPAWFDLSPEVDITRAITPAGETPSAAPWCGPAPAGFCAVPVMGSSTCGQPLHALVAAAAGGSAGRCSRHSPARQSCVPAAAHALHGSAGCLSTALPAQTRGAGSRATRSSCGWPTRP